MTKVFRKTEQLVDATKRLSQNMIKVNQINNRFVQTLNEHQVRYGALGERALQSTEKSVKKVETVGLHPTRKP